jgi:hypothetical protein
MLTILRSQQCNSELGCERGRLLRVVPARRYPGVSSTSQAHGWEQQRGQRPIIRQHPDLLLSHGMSESCGERVYAMCLLGNHI